MRPLDVELGLGAETLMPQLARAVCRAGGMGALDEAAAQVREDHSVVVHLGRLIVVQVGRPSLVQFRPSLDTRGYRRADQ